MLSIPQNSLMPVSGERMRKKVKKTFRVPGNVFCMFPFIPTFYQRCWWVGTAVDSIVLLPEHACFTLSYSPSWGEFAANVDNPVPAFTKVQDSDMKWCSTYWSLDGSSAIVLFKIGLFTQSDLEHLLKMFDASFRLKQARENRPVIFSLWIWHPAKFPSIWLRLDTYGLDTCPNPHTIHTSIQKVWMKMWVCDPSPWIIWLLGPIPRGGGKKMEKGGRRRNR